MYIFSYNIYLAIKYVIALWQYAFKLCKTIYKTVGKLLNKQQTRKHKGWKS